MAGCSGLIVEQTPETITLRDAKGVRSQVARSEIDELKESDVSLMPESLYKEFSPQQLRDLFSFLQTEPQPAVRNDHERIRSSVRLPGLRGDADVERRRPCRR